MKCTRTRFNLHIAEAMTDMESCLQTLCRLSQIHSFGIWYTLAAG